MIFKVVKAFAAYDREKLNVCQDDRRICLAYYKRFDSSREEMYYSVRRDEFKTSDLDLENASAAEKSRRFGLGVGLLKEFLEKNCPGVSRRKFQGN
jgi:hypothetical protein